MHAGPMYAHTYSCPKTLIQTFYAFVSLFYLYNMLLSCPVFILYMCLPPYFVIVCPSHARLGFTFVTPASLKFNLIAFKVKLMNYLIYFEGVIILYYDIYK